MLEHFFRAVERVNRRHSGARLLGREPGIQRCFSLRALHIEIPGSPPSGRALRGPVGVAPE
jgi:hypothetical protein